MLSYLGQYRASEEELQSVWRARLLDKFKLTHYRCQGRR